MVLTDHVPPRGCWNLRGELETRKVEEVLHGSTMASPL